MSSYKNYRGVGGRGYSNDRGNGYDRGTKRKFEDDERRRIDRFCVDCRSVVLGQVVEKPSKCPRVGCRTQMRFRGIGGNMWEKFEGLMGRCPNCDLYIIESDCCCQFCGWQNLTTMDRRDKKKMAELKQAEFKNKFRLEQAEKNLIKEQQKNAKLTEEKNKLIEINQIQENELLNSRTPLSSSETPDSENAANNGDEMIVEDDIILE